MADKAQVAVRPPGTEPIRKAVGPAASVMALGGFPADLSNLRPTAVAVMAAGSCVAIAAGAADAEGQAAASRVLACAR